MQTAVRLIGDMCGGTAPSGCGRKPPPPADGKQRMDGLPPAGEDKAKWPREARYLSPGITQLLRFLQHPAAFLGLARPG